jgi:ArsR family transcriptional regulator
MMSVMRLGACLSDSLVLRALALLREKELCSCEIEAALSVSYAKVENALNKLRVTGLVSATRRNQWLYYKLNPEYTDLIETIWEAYSNELEWDKALGFDQRRMGEILNLRVDDACPRSAKRSLPNVWRREPESSDSRFEDTAD